MIRVYSEFVKREGGVGRVSGEFGVGGEGGTGDVVREESGVGREVAESDDVVGADYATATGVGEGFCGFDDPVVV